MPICTVHNVIRTGTLLMLFAVVGMPSAAVGEAEILEKSRAIVRGFPRSHQAQLAQEVLEVVADGYLQDAGLDAEKLQQVAIAFSDTRAGSQAKLRLNRIQYFAKESQAYQAVIAAWDDIDRLRILVRPPEGSAEETLIKDMQSQETAKRRVHQLESQDDDANSQRELSELVEILSQDQDGKEVMARVKQLQEERETAAARKLREALCRPTLYDQRWRRLVELTEKFPGTDASKKAQECFQQHLESIPPVVIRNSSTEVLMVKYTPAYELEEFHVLQADAEHTVHTAFPLYVSLEALATEHAETLRGGQSCEYNGQDFVTQ